MATHVKPDDCKLYALGVLDGEEKDALTAHLRACPDCATNIAWAHQMIALVGFASIPALPRPAVKEKILRRIRAENPQTWNARRPLQIADLDLEAERPAPTPPAAPEPEALNASTEPEQPSPEQPSLSTESEPEPDLRIEAEQPPNPPELHANAEAAPETQSQPSELNAPPIEPEPEPDLRIEAEQQSPPIESAPEPDLSIEPEQPPPNSPELYANAAAAPETQSQPSELNPPPGAPEPEPPPTLTLKAAPEPPSIPQSPPSAERETRSEDERPLYQREPVSHRRESEPDSGSNGRVLLIMAGLAVLVLAGAAAKFWQQDRAHQRQADQLQAAVAQYRLDLQNLQARPKLPEPIGEDRVLAAPGTVHIVLTGAAGHGGVLFNPHDGTVACSALLPPPPAGSKYQLWAFSWTGVPANLGAMSASQPAQLTTHIRPGSWVSRFVITAESETGTPNPTGTRMLAGGLEE